ncbi:MAG: serine/threonine protein kinase [Hydrococcus sp. RU_2_2]|nr:serine/threonine protein kinase [Hydrococcus sp. RU_2_2]NJP21441.1 serine/threonine protein kinase [Hydrococcus sp. CRU_1_1]
MTTDPRHRRLLANRYQLIDLVGSGAMGHVYRAEDKVLGGVTVAVKFLSQALLNSKMRERFEREAQISAQLGEKGINIIRVRDYGVDERDIPFYVMEFLQGDSLSEIIKYQPLPLSRFLKITRQICFGLECAHKGIIYQGEVCPIVHRDIKPSNILVSQDSALGELVKILDFGIAKLIQSNESQTQSFMGTLAYCSPEQMEGKELDNRSDIYSLGIMMYEMLTGEMPIFPENSSFGGWYEAHHYAKPQPISPNFTIPSTLEALIMKCLEKLPSNRFQSVSELIQALDKVEPIRQNSPPVISEVPPILGRGKTTSRSSVSSTKDLCLQKSWPDDKPQQKIVFPNLIKASEGTFTSLWVMLDRQDIQNRLSSIRYNQFLFMPNPHPTILWITVLYNRQHGPRWLPCYLDLKTPAGQKLARLLADTGNYWLLFFAIENPQRCQQVMRSTIAPNQCKMLQEWADTSQVLQAGKPQIAKNILKQELEKLKPRIVGKLEGMRTAHATDVSGL